jgi:hypothetical protein
VIFCQLWWALPTLQLARLPEPYMGFRPTGKLANGPTG